MSGIQTEDGLRKTLKLIFFVSAALLVLRAGLSNLPRLFGFSAYAVTSGSMEPEIPVGSLVLVNQQDRTPDVGKIMTYHITDNPSSMIVTHRVNEITETGELIMKGDANQTADLNRIKAEQIIGTDVCALPYLGYLISDLRIRIGLTAVSAGAAFGAVFLGKQNKERE
ncbi:MAG: signal peptidase I [Solobacterium sp.]|nr:signal peptidase I [Solobacterium sp.]